LNLFPVPAGQVVHIQLIGVSDNDQFDALIMDGAGKIVDKLMLRGRDHDLDIEDYPPGNYFLRVSNKSLVLLSRFVRR
jgi:hypothetical protein